MRNDDKRQLYPSLFTSALPFNIRHVLYPHVYLSLYHHPAPFPRRLVVIFIIEELASLPAQGFII